MKKAVFYGRYSSVNQTEQSIEGQLHVCEKYAEQNGLEIIAQYVDRAQSGKTANRKEFQRMITDSEKGMFEAVLVYKLDRFARNRFDSAMYKRQLRENGVKVVSATENISDTPEGIMMEAVLEGMDEYYSAELARKLHRGMAESFKKGYFINRAAPFGYRVENHRLVIDEQKAPLATEMFRRYASGERFTDLIQWLDGMGIPNGNGRSWQNWNLSVILKNRAYIGEYTRSDMEGFAPCPAITDRETFNKVQNRLAEFAHRARENKTKNHFDYFLSGFLICGKCGKHVGGSSTSQRWHYYRCANCRKQNYNAEKLHERVLTTLAEYLDSNKLDQLAAATYEAYQQEQETSEVPALEQELQDVEKQLRNAVNAILKGIDTPFLKETMDELEKRRTALKSAILDAPTPLPEFTVNQFRYILEKKLSNSAREMLSTFVNRIILKEDELVICINLTDENNTPPLEQYLCKVGDMSGNPRLHKIIYMSGWLFVAA